MEQSFVADKTFSKTDFTLNPPAVSEYENCRFVNCNFLNCDLSGIIFSDCEFSGCDLSMAKLTRTALREVQFKDCKMLGLDFEACNKPGFSVGFDNCMLDHSSFIRAKLVRTIFRNSKLREVDFTECDLSGSFFDNCDLTRTIFAFAVLEKADFSTAYNYSMDPEQNKVKKARFSATGVLGLLDKYDIEIT